jgi:hypothetical protein
MAMTVVATALITVVGEGMISGTGCFPEIGSEPCRTINIPQMAEGTLTPMSGLTATEATPATLAKTTTAERGISLIRQPEETSVKGKG